MTADSDRAAELIRLGVPTLHEANQRRGLMRRMQVLVGEAFAGPALTVAIPAGDNLGLHLALAEAEPGTVLCVASAGRGIFAAAGELIAEAARARRLLAEATTRWLRHGRAARARGPSLYGRIITFGYNVHHDRRTHPTVAASRSGENRLRINRGPPGIYTGPARAGRHCGASGGCRPR